MTNRWKDLQQARREAERFTRRKGLRRSFTLGYSLISRFIENTNKRRRISLPHSLCLWRFFYKVFVFTRVRLHLAELANWNNRPEVSKNAKSLFKWRFRRRRLWGILKSLISFFTMRWLAFVRQGRGESSFYSGPSDCYHNRETQFNLEVYNGPCFRNEQPWLRLVKGVTVVMH